MWKSWKWLGWIGCLGITSTFALVGSSVKAQLIPDRTLGTENSTITPQGVRDLIEGGARRGSNLFHSFVEFNIGNQQQVFFANPTGITNILTRVTGNNVSNIFGTLGVDGSANLFLINPNGIIFGAGAQLNMGGSFIGSTADSIKFSDGREFSAKNPQASPLLTISVPIGLQLGANPGVIRVEGRGNPNVFPTDNIGLAVAPGQTLALVGGDVTLTGGILTAPSGRVEIGSVANGEVSLTPISAGWRLGYDRIQEFRDIQLLSQSSLWNPNVSSNPEGGIQVQGGRVILNERSQIASVNQGNFPGADITINAAQSLEIGGIVGNFFPFSSWVVNQVDRGASGNGGQIAVTTPELRIQDGGRIQTQSFGEGSARNVTLNVDQSILVSGFTPLNADLSQFGQNLNSRISSENFATGTGGNISLSTRQLTLLNGGQVGTLVGALATGNGGNISANVTDAIAATNGNPFNPLQTSAITSESLGAGKGGDITVTTAQLTLSDGALIQSIAQGTGKGGDISVRASNSFAAIGVNPFIPFNSGGIVAQTGGPGNGGNTSVSTERLSIQAGATVSSSVFDQRIGVPVLGSATGKAGDVIVNADQVEIVGANPLVPFSANPSVLGSATFGPGNAGDVTVSTRRLTLKDGGSLTSIVFPPFNLLRQQLPETGTGDGGNLAVNASESISVVGVAPLTFISSILGTSTATSGNAGNTLINAPQLVVRDGGQVTSSTRATGAAGQVTINASESILVSGTALNGTPAEVSANALIANPALRQALWLPAIPTGDTGELTIHTNRLTVQDQGRVSVLHEGTGNAGRLQLQAESVVLDRGGSISATTQSGFGGNINLDIQELLLLQNRSSLAVEAQGGTGNGGNLTIKAGFVVAVPTENSDITANAIAGKGGNIGITTNGIYGLEFRERQTPLSDITASSEFGVDGTFELNTANVDPSRGLTKLPENFTEPSDLITTGCLADQGSTFVITGRGGLPEDPTQTLRGRTVWQDLRNLSEVRGQPLEGSNVERLRVESSNLQPGLSPVALTTLTRDKNRQIVEAQGWVINSTGQVELVAHPLQVTPHSSWQRATECHTPNLN